MRALTLWQPWAWAVVAGHKLVENRPWPPPANLWADEVIAIHAGKTWDPGGATSILELLELDEFPDRDPLVRAAGAIVGVARIANHVRVNSAHHQHHPDQLDPEEARWFFGPYGWVLRDVRRLDVAVPCRGFQMLWKLPPEVELEVRRQLAAKEAA